MSSTTRSSQRTSRSRFVGVAVVCLVTVLAGPMPLFASPSPVPRAGKDTNSSRPTASARSGVPVRSPVSGGTAPDACEALATASPTSPPPAHLVVHLGARTVYTYEDDARYLLCARPLHLTDIQLQPGEKLVDVSAGDTVRWVIGTTQSRSGTATRVHLLIKPLEPDLETNLIITTDRRAYQLLAKSSPVAAHGAIAWVYPQEERAKLAAARARQAQLEQQTVATGLTPDQLRFDYRITPAKRYDWTPVRVFDDGAKTYIQFPPETRASEIPALFVKRDRELQLVNYRVRGDYYVVDRLFDEAELRVGREAVTVARIQRSKPRWTPPEPIERGSGGH